MTRPVERPTLGASEVAERIVAEFQVREDMHPAVDLFVWLRTSITAAILDERAVCAKVAAQLDPDAMHCTSGHDRCAYGPDSGCPYCENRSPIASAIRTRPA